MQNGKSGNLSAEEKKILELEKEERKAGKAAEPKKQKQSRQKNPKFSPENPLAEVPEGAEENLLSLARMINKNTLAAAHEIIPNVSDGVVSLSDDVLSEDPMLDVALAAVINDYTKNAKITPQAFFLGVLGMKLLTSVRVDVAKGREKLRAKKRKQDPLPKTDSLPRDAGEREDDKAKTNPK